MSLFPSMTLAGSEVAYLRPRAPRVGLVIMHGRGGTGPGFASRRRGRGLVFGDLLDQPIPGLAVMWPTGRGVDAEGKTIWRIPGDIHLPAGASDVPVIRECHTVLRGWGCEFIIDAGESYGAAMAWYLAVYGVSGDATAPVNCEFPAWAASQPYDGRPLWHEVGCRDTNQYPTGPAEAEAAALRFRRWVGMPDELEPTLAYNGTVRSWEYGPARVHVGSTWGHAWRGGAWATHRRLAELGLEALR